MAKKGGRRTALVIIIVLLVIVIIAGGGLLLMRQLGGQAPSTAEEGGTAEGVQQPQVQVTPTPAPVLNIIIAARDIPRATRLSTADVAILAWPITLEAPPPFGALVVGDAAGAGLEQVQNRIARVDILEGQPILDFMLTPGDQPVDLANVGSDAALKIPSGMVAIAIPIDRLSAVAYALREGDHVDVLASFAFVQVDQEFQTTLPNTAVLLRETAEGALQVFDFPYGRQDNTLLGGLFGSTVVVVPDLERMSELPYRQTTQLLIDNVMVLRVGDWPLTDLNQPIVIAIEPTPPPAAATPEAGTAGVMPTPTPIPEPTEVPQVPIPTVITLVMTRQDALVLKYALETGARIDLALRSALDHEVTDIDTEPVTLDYIINFYDVPVPNKLPVVLGRDILGNTLLDMIEAMGSPTGG